MDKGKKLKPFNIFTMTYGAAIGSGIFLMTGIGIAYTGKSVPWALLLGAFYAIMTELYILVICSFFPSKGGYYDQISFVGIPIIKGGKR